MGLFSSREAGQTTVLSPLPLGIKTASRLYNTVAGQAGSSRQLLRTPSPRRTPCASPSANTDVAANPLERVPTELVIERPRPQHAKQPTPEELARDGIKVRDFAYEKSSIAPLPPVPVVRRPFSGDLKRARDETDFDFGRRMRMEARRDEMTSMRLEPLPRSRGNQPGPSSSPSQGSRCDRNGSSSVPRYSLLSALSDALTARNQPSLRQSPPKLQTKHTTQFSQFSSIVEAPSTSESQTSAAGSSDLPHLSTSQDSDDEEIIKTPIVTPNGSLFFQDDASVSDNVLDTSALPQSQVGSLLEAPELGGSDDLAASQMGVIESQSQSQPAWQQQPPQTPPNALIDASDYKPASFPQKIPSKTRLSRQGTLAALLSPPGISGRRSRSANLKGHSVEHEALLHTPGRYHLRGRRKSSPGSTLSQSPKRSSPIHSADSTVVASSAAYCTRLRSRTPQKPMLRDEVLAKSPGKKRSASKAKDEGEGKSKRPRVSDADDEAIASTPTSHTLSKGPLRRSPRKIR